MPEQSSFKKWFGLFVLSLALGIIILDTTLLNVSLATIIRDFNTDIQSIQWVITIYSLTLAALTITGGRLGDIFGRKRMFLTGAILFAIGSFLASISQNVTTMIIGESIIEGIGAALMIPATSSILLSTFRGKERAIAFGVWGAVAGSAAAIGPIVGGWLATDYSWRWGFRINVFVVLFLLIASRVLTESRDTEEKPRLDIGGVLLSSLGLLTFVFGIIEASRYGWWFGKADFIIGDRLINLPWNMSVTPWAMAIGLLLIGLFVWWEKRVEARGETPLVSLKLFENNQFTSGSITTAILSLGQAGLIFTLPVFLQSVRQLSAYETGKALLPMSLTLLVVAPMSAVLSRKITPKRLIQIGLLISALSYTVLYQTMSVDATAQSFIFGLILQGIGMGLVMSQINNLTLSAVSVEEAGEASGVNSTMRQIGSSLGSAILGAVMLTALSTNLSAGIKNSPNLPEQLKTPLEEAISSQTSNVEFGGGARLDSKLPASVTAEITAISHQATVDANQSALAWAIIFSLLGLVASIWLPNVQNLERNESAASKH